MKSSILNFGKIGNMTKMILGFGGAFSLVGLNSINQQREINRLQSIVQESKEKETKETQHLVSIYVPEDNVEEVKEVMFEAGAGLIDNYAKCSWQTLGEGQFSPLSGSNPYIGEQGKLEKVKEYRVEMLCDDSSLEKVIIALKSKKEGHPYETIPLLIFKNSAS